MSSSPVTAVNLISLTAVLTEGEAYFSPKESRDEMPERICILAEFGDAVKIRQYAVVLTRLWL